MAGGSCAPPGVLWPARDVLTVPPTTSQYGLPFPATPADYSSRPENFQCLQDCRRAVCDALGLEEAAVELRWEMRRRRRCF